MIFDHLGLVVPTLGDGRKHLSNGLDVKKWTEEFEDPINGVRIQFGIDPAGVCYELLEPLDEKSPVYRALQTKASILHHVAYRVAALDTHQQKLFKAGWARTSEPKPAIAYGGRRIQFFISPLRFVVELIEAEEHEHVFSFTL